MTSSFDFTLLTAILPELLILLVGLLILVIDPFWKDEARRVGLGWLAAGGLFAALVISLLIGQPGSGALVFGGMIRFDWFSFFFKMFFIFGAAITALFMMDSEGLNKRAEAYLLLLAGTIGMNFMASSADLIMLYLAIETTSIPMYVLAGFLLDDDKSTEAGFKYLLFGAMTSAILLYGFSLLFGFAGTTNLYEIAKTFNTNLPLALGVIVLIVIGLSFKVSLFPFHFWAPDVYEGAPTPVTGFLSTASKAAGFAVLLRMFLAAFPSFAVDWAMIFAIVSALTMTIGNFVALTQKTLKRLLAYSSIAHAGYALIGLVAYTTLGAASVVFYMIAYIMTNLAAFGVIIAFSRVSESDDFKSYYGMSRRSPALALVMLIAFLSLAGMPPFGGFVAKVFVFAAAVQAGYVWLAVIGIINSIVGVYYYLTMLKYVYLYRMPGENEAQFPVPMSRPYALALTLLSIGIIMLGVLFTPWYDFAERAAALLR